MHSFTFLQYRTSTCQRKRAKNGSFVFELNEINILHSIVGTQLGGVASFTSGVVLMAGTPPQDPLGKGKGKVERGEERPQPKSLYEGSEEKQKEMTFGTAEPYNSDRDFHGFVDPELDKKIPENVRTVLETPTVPNLNATYSPTLSEQLSARIALRKQGVEPLTPAYPHTEPIHVGENVDVFPKVVQDVGEVAILAAQGIAQLSVPPSVPNVTAITAASVGAQKAFKIKTHTLQDQTHYIKHSIPAGMHDFQNPASDEEAFEEAGKKTSVEFLKHSPSLPIMGEESDPETLYARSKSSSSLSTLTERDLDDEFRDMLQSANLSRAKAASDPTAFNSDPLGVSRSIGRPKADSAPTMVQVTDSASNSARNPPLSEDVLKTQLGSTTVSTNTESFMVPSIAESLTKAANAEDILSNISLWMTQLSASVGTILLSVTLRNGLPALLRRFPQESAFAVRYPGLYARLQGACTLVNDQKRADKMMLYVSLYMAICLFMLTGNVLKLATIIKCAHALTNQDNSN